VSEKIYTWLLRLYPSQFRYAYGEEALQLFRDRLRDEKGFFPRLRLWLDLLADLAISVPKQYLHLEPALAGTSAQPRLYGTPSFFVLGDEAPRPGTLFLGGVVTLAALCAFSILLGHPGTHARMRTIVRGQFEGFARLSHQQVPQPKPQETADATNRPADAAFKVDAGERQRVVDAAAAILKKHYIDRKNAENMANALVAHEKNGDDDAVKDGAGFAALLTRQMRDVSPDKHLAMEFSQDPLPRNPMGQTAEDLARYREVMKQQNCTFERVEILPHNIGYVKLNSFPDVSVCQPTAVAAMASLNHADGIIYDLRDNRGGEPAMVALMAAYLFDHPEYWYNPRENTTGQSWTHSPVPGNRLADKPVYLLTSARTISGAEQFCYDLKMLRRATLVGETTGGAAHSGVWHRIDDHFGMGVPETRPINPFAEADWAETGVEPDVKVKAADALEAAKKLAESRLLKMRKTDGKTL
jgi:hypothetical protein